MQIDPAELAQLAYKAYGGAVHGRSVRDEPLPDWNDLGPKVQNAWEVAAEAVARKALRLGGQA